MDIDVIIRNDRLRIGVLKMGTLEFHHAITSRSNATDDFVFGQDANDIVVDANARIARPRQSGEGR